MRLSFLCHTQGRLCGGPAMTWKPAAPGDFLRRGPAWPAHAAGWPIWCRTPGPLPWPSRRQKPCWPQTPALPRAGTPAAGRRGGTAVCLGCRHHELNPAWPRSKFHNSAPFRRRHFVGYTILYIRIFLCQRKSPPARMGRVFPLTCQIGNLPAYEKNGLPAFLPCCFWLSHWRCPLRPWKAMHLPPSPAPRRPMWSTWIPTSWSMKKTARHR